MEWRKEERKKRQDQRFICWETPRLFCRVWELDDSISLPSPAFLADPKLCIQKMIYFLVRFSLSRTHWRKLMWQQVTRKLTPRESCRWAARFNCPAAASLPFTSSSSSRKCSWPSPSCQFKEKGEEEVQRMTISRAIINWMKTASEFCYYFTSLILRCYFPSSSPHPSSHLVVDSARKFPAVAAFNSFVFPSSSVAGGWVRDSEEGNRGGNKLNKNSGASSWKPSRIVFRYICYANWSACGRWWRRERPPLGHHSPRTKRSFPVDNGNLFSSFGRVLGMI